MDHEYNFWDEEWPMRWPGSEVEVLMGKLVILVNDQEGKTQKRTQVISLWTGRKVRVPLRGRGGERLKIE